MSKNLHLEHLEDEILNQGIDGGRGSIYFLLALRDMLKGNSNSSYKMTVKWDGAPAIFCGPHPETGKFFVAKKSLFNKTPLYYSSEQEIKDAPELKGDLQDKFLYAFRYLSKIGMTEILQGDLMFTTKDKKTQMIDGSDYITFQPNTILYAVLGASNLAKAIDRASLGIVFHTTYKGKTIDSLSASFGANINGLKQGAVWIEDASYKDVSGTGNMTAKETLSLTNALTETGKSFHKITARDLKTFMKIQDTMASKGALGATYKTYTNSLIRSGNFRPNSQDYINYVSEYWQTKIVDKVKQEKTKEIKRSIGNDILRELNTLRGMIDALTSFQANLVYAKNLIMSALNRVRSIGTFVQTDSGLKVVNPEGYVAIDHIGNAVKIVDRMEFSQNNFTATKNWSK